jgi:phosphotransferase system IIB component
VVEKPSPGTIFYNPPDSMVTHRAKRIIARIANEGALETLKAQILEDLGGKETVRHFKLKTTRSMFVELHGQKGIFSINSLSPPNPQRLDNDRGFAEWVWDVMPLKRGLHELTLVVSCYESNGEGGHCHVVNIPPVVTKIRIRVNKTKKVRQMAIAASLLLVGTMFDEEMKTDYPEMHEAARHYIAGFLDFSTPQPLEKVTPVGEKRQEAEKGPPGPEKSP